MDRRHSVSDSLTLRQSSGDGHYSTSRCRLDIIIPGSWVCKWTPPSIPPTGEINCIILVFKYNKFPHLWLVNIILFEKLMVKTWSLMTILDLLE